MDSRSLRRRVALVDLGWEEADALPALLATPQVDVALVVGRPGDPGLRVAELCGLRSSVELSDLARDLVDQALVGAGSERRERVERLARALGAEVTEPRRI